MSSLSNVSAHAVLPLGAYRLDQLKRSAEQTDQVWFECDFSGSKSKSEVLAKLGESFKLPKHFGKNYDALYDCLSDLTADGDAANPGFVVILKNLPTTKEFNEDQRTSLLDVFRDVADYFYDEKIAFRVFYSLNQQSD